MNLVLSCYCLLDLFLNVNFTVNIKLPTQYAFEFFTCTGVFDAFYC